MGQKIPAWVAPVAFTLLLWGTVGVVRPLTEWLRSQALLTGLIWILFTVSVLALLGAGWTRVGALGRLIWFGVVGMVYLWAMTHWVVAPEERFHFILIGWVTYLYDRFFRSRWPNAFRVPVLSFLAGAGVGGIEEGLQTFYPDRFFDWRDVGINVLAALLATVLLITENTSSRLKSKGYPS